MTTEVHFHFGLSNKFQYACRFLRKAQANGIGVLVLLDKGRVVDFSEKLWTISSNDLIGHCHDNSPSYVKDISNIWLCSEAPEDAVLKRFSIVLNLLDQPLNADLKIAKTVELVGIDDADKSQARKRWRHYQLASITPISFEIKETQ